MKKHYLHSTRTKTSIADHNTGGSVIPVCWCCVVADGFGVLDVFAECRVAGAEWPRKHRTCLDGRERWESSFGEWSARWRRYAVHRFICWARSPPSSLGSTAFRCRIVWSVTLQYFLLSLYFSAVWYCIFTIALFSFHIRIVIRPSNSGT